MKEKTLYLYGVAYRFEGVWCVETETYADEGAALRHLVELAKEVEGVEMAKVIPLGYFPCPESVTEGPSGAEGGPNAT